MFVQIAIIILGFFLLYRGLASPGAHSMRAGGKIGLALLALLMVFAVLSPDLLTHVANRAGIGRGADLVLYALAGAFIFYVSTQYLQSQRHRDAIFRVARELALLEAHSRYPQAGASTASDASAAAPALPPLDAPETPFQLDRPIAGDTQRPDAHR